MRWFFSFQTPAIPRSQIIFSPNRKVGIGEGFTIFSWWWGSRPLGSCVVPSCLFWSGVTSEVCQFHLHWHLLLKTAPGRLCVLHSFWLWSEHSGPLLPMWHHLDTAWCYGYSNSFSVSGPNLLCSPLLYVPGVFSWLTYCVILMRVILQFSLHPIVSIADLPHPPSQLQLNDTRLRVRPEKKDRS